MTWVDSRENWPPPLHLLRNIEPLVRNRSLRTTPPLRVPWLDLHEEGDSPWRHWRSTICLKSCRGSRDDCFYSLCTPPPPPSSTRQQCFEMSQYPRDMAAFVLVRRVPLSDLNREKSMQMRWRKGKSQGGRKKLISERKESKNRDIYFPNICFLYSSLFLIPLSSSIDWSNADLSCANLFISP